MPMCPTDNKNSKDVATPTQEQQFLLKLAEAYRTYDAFVIEKYLADDMHFSSIWAYPEIESRHLYLNYLCGVLQRMKWYRARLKFELVEERWHEYGLLITNVKAHGGGYGGFVADFNAEGKVCLLTQTQRSFF